MDILNYEQPTEAEVAEVLAYWDGVRAAINAGADAAPPTPDADLLARVGIHQQWQAAMACQHPEVSFTQFDGASPAVAALIVAMRNALPDLLDLLPDGSPAATVLLEEALYLLRNRHSVAAEIIATRETRAEALMARIASHLEATEPPGPSSCSCSCCGERLSESSEVATP